MSDAIKHVARESEHLTLPTTLYLHTQLLFNREVSWLEFNRRVLQEAMDSTQPLLERLKFLSIFSTNLDEFFMIRVSGLKEQIEQGVSDLSADGLTATAQLKQINTRLLPMVGEQMRCLKEEILPQLGQCGIIITSYRALPDRERRALNEYFMENVFPVLTPQAVDPSHPFPYISNLSLNLGVMIEPGADSIPGPTSRMIQPRFARVKVPPIVPRLVPVGDTGMEFTLLEELIAANIHILFAGMQTGEPHVFRVTRDADIEIREDEANDLLRMMEIELRNIIFLTSVRM
jgi:polyphosphate kinase